MTVLQVLRFGTVLRQAREDAGLDQHAVAKAVGVSQSQVSKWEKGHAHPTLPQLRAIVEATGAEYLTDKDVLGLLWIPTSAGSRAA